MDEKLKNKGLSFISGIKKYASENELDAEQTDNFVATCINALPAARLARDENSDVVKDFSDLWLMDKKASDEEISKMDMGDPVKKTIEALNKDFDRVCATVGSWL